MASRQKSKVKPSRKRRASARQTKRAAPLDLQLVQRERKSAEAFAKKRKSRAAPLDLHDARMASNVSVKVAGKYDAAQTSDNNVRHWQWADALSARAANSPAVRRTLRNRARYEIANNSYARGMTLTQANDTIGTGPQLHLISDAKEEDVEFVENEFTEWFAEIGAPAKLRTMRVTKTEDGESFGAIVNAPRNQCPVKVGLRLYEAEQVSNPRLDSVIDVNSDGIILDENLDPISYQFLKRHPGDLIGVNFETDYIILPASMVIHYFRADRPGQVRGIPEITAALPLFAMLRAYSLAVLDAAQTAANLAGLMYTSAPADGEAVAVKPMQGLEIERNTLLTLPEGWQALQMKAEQPTTTYPAFKQEILGEIARCLNMPFNVAAGNSSGYNYSSARLDLQAYLNSIAVERDQISRVILDRLFYRWLLEARSIAGYLPDAFQGDVRTVPHQWFWDGGNYVIDPEKEANALSTNLANHTTTLAESYAKRRLKWKDQIRQRGKELALMRAEGVSVEDVGGTVGEKLKRVHIKDQPPVAGPVGGK